MSPETLDLALEVRKDRMEVPVNLPESLEVAILQECIRSIDVFLEHYRGGKDGRDFRYVNRKEVRNVTKAKILRQEVVKDAAEQFAWLTSDEPSCGLGVTFVEVCDAQGIKDVTNFRKTLLDILLGDLHPNALITLREYICWKEKFDADSDSEWANHSAARKLQTQA